MNNLNLPEKIVIFDGEYTTWEGAFARNWTGQGECRETVQLAAILVETENFTELSVFEAFSKPTLNPTLSDYFIDLTHITQEEVDQKGIPFPELLKNFTQWTDNYPLYCFDGKVDGSRLFDRESLMENCKALGIEFPFDPDRFKNINLVFANHGYEVKQSGSAPLAFGLKLPATIHNALNDVRGLILGLKALNEKLKML